MGSGAEGSAALPEKVGAGLLLFSRGEVLLLRRAGSHNFGKWGLPGGNADAEDGGNLLVTARREAQEELGGVPAHLILDTILTRRGQRLQKHYTVFLAGISPETRASWRPQLNMEHSEWAWVPVGQLASLDLHPVVRKLLQHNQQQVLAALAQSTAGTSQQQAAHARSSTCETNVPQD